MIDNPEYIGVWSPRQIANPNYFSEETHPEAFKTLVAPIGGVAVEIWTMSGGIHFDNIYISNDLGDASEWARLSFGEEQEKEAAAKKAAASAKRRAERAKQWEEGGFGAKVSVIIGATVDIIADNLVASIVTGSLVLLGTMYFCCKNCCGEDELEDIDIPSSGLPSEEDFKTAEEIAGGTADGEPAAEGKAAKADEQEAKADQGAAASKQGGKTEASESQQASSQESSESGAGNKSS